MAALRRGKSDVVAVPSETATFSFVDLFAGIGGFHLALGRGHRGLGGACVLTSEIDRQARRVYRENFGGLVKGDIRKVIARSAGQDVWPEDPDDDLLKGPAELPPHDVLAAGFPCQPFSKSGGQQGLEDQTRGTLFFDIATILEMRRPRFVMLENVRNLAAHDGGRTWQVIVRRLHQLGYKVNSTPLVFSPHLLSPEDGGAPQFRERVFVLAEHSDHNPGRLDWDFHVPNKPVGAWHPSQWDLRAWLQEHPPMESDMTPYEWRGDRRRHALAWGELLADLPPGRVPQPLKEYAWKLRPDLEGLPVWKQRHNTLNSVFYKEHRALLDAWRRKHRPETWIKSDRKLEWQAQDAARDRPDDILNLQVQFRPSGLRVKKPTYAGALVAITQTPYMGWLDRSMTPSEAASLQGIPVHDRDAPYRLHDTPAVAFKQLGNGVNAGVVRFLARQLFEHAGFTAFGSEPRVRPAIDLRASDVPASTALTA